MYLRVAGVAAVVLLMNLCGVTSAETFRTIDNAEIRRQSNVDTTYDFSEKVDGKSTVVIHAPKGTVKFSTAPSFGNEGSKIDGASKVLLEAERVIFNAKVDGKSIVLVIIPSGGLLEVNDKIDGEAQLYWCKAKDNDSEPTVKTRLENPRGGAKYNQVTREEMNRLMKEYDLR